MEEHGVEPDVPAPEQAAEKAVNDNALLDGENPNTRHPDDIEHWIHAYSELIDFKEGLLEKSREEIDRMDNPNARKEAGDIDVTILSHQLERFRRRLDFWKARRLDLQRGA